MKKRILQSILFIGLTSMFWGCYPDSPDYVDELDIVYTNYDQNYSFPGHMKYAMPDSIVKITGSAATSGSLEFVDSYYAGLVLTRIKSNMAGLGYTLVSDTALADVILFPMAMEVTSTYYYYDYYYYYWGWYYPYYPYYPYSVSTSYTTGTLIMSMIDRRNFTVDGKTRAPWIGIINGLMEGYAAEFPSRMNKAVDQAFHQSQYLHQ